MNKNNVSMGLKRLSLILSIIILIMSAILSYLFIFRNYNYWGIGRRTIGYTIEHYYNEEKDKYILNGKTYEKTKWVDGEDCLVLTDENNSVIDIFFGTQREVQFLKIPTRPVYSFIFGAGAGFFFFLLFILCIKIFYWIKKGFEQDVQN